MIPSLYARAPDNDDVKGTEPINIQLKGFVNRRNEEILKRETLRTKHWF